MKITITPDQFMDLKKIDINPQLSVDTRIEEMDLRNVAAHLEEVERILGKDVLHNALVNNQEIYIEVDWER